MSQHASPVAAIVVNRRANTGCCRESLRARVYPMPTIFVVGNASTDDSPATTARHDYRIAAVAQAESSAITDDMPRDRLLVLRAPRCGSAAWARTVFHQARTVISLFLTDQGVARTPGRMPMHLSWRDTARGRFAAFVTTAGGNR